MRKHIDAEAFFKLINTTLPYDKLDYPDKAVYNAAISDVCDMLIHFPAADVVEVGRCKDCKHRGYQYRDFHGTEKVICWKDGYGIRKNANGYCDEGDFRDEKDGDTEWMTQSADRRR